jgi:hypothetical protein
MLLLGDVACLELLLYPVHEKRRRAYILPSGKRSFPDDAECSASTMFENPWSMHIDRWGRARVRAMSKAIGFFVATSRPVLLGTAISRFYGSSS